MHPSARAPDEGGSGEGLPAAQLHAECDGQPPGGCLAKRGCRTSHRVFRCKNSAPQFQCVGLKDEATPRYEKLRSRSRCAMATHHWYVVIWYSTAVIYTN